MNLYFKSKFYNIFYEMMATAMFFPGNNKALTTVNFLHIHFELFHFKSTFVYNY